MDEDFQICKFCEMDMLLRFNGHGFKVYVCYECGAELHLGIIQHWGVWHQKPAWKSTIWKRG